MAKFVIQAPVDATLQRANYIPSNIAVSHLLSTTNSAYTCFTQQKFSADLQAFLINYVITVQSYYSIYK